MTISTVIVDDERPARDELAFLLKGFPELEVIAQGKNGLEAVSLIKEHDPDLVFLDVQMPGLDGFGVIKKLVERRVRRLQGSVRFTLGKRERDPEDAPIIQITHAGRRIEAA